VAFQIINDTVCMLGRSYNTIAHTAKHDRVVHYQTCNLQRSASAVPQGMTQLFYLHQTPNTALPVKPRYTRRTQQQNQKLQTACKKRWHQQQHPESNTTLHRDMHIRPHRSNVPIKTHSSVQNYINKKRTHLYDSQRC
jgi:hypothetical protein